MRSGQEEGYAFRADGLWPCTVLWSWHGPGRQGRRDAVQLDLVVVVTFDESLTVSHKGKTCFVAKEYEV